MLLSNLDHMNVLEQEHALLIERVIGHASERALLLLVPLQILLDQSRQDRDCGRQKQFYGVSYFEPIRRFERFRYLLDRSVGDA